MIVDCFPWFAPYGEELLVLRINLLKDHVDKFIIVESDQTHSGQPVERKFHEIARKHGLPMEKIIYIEHEMPKNPVPANIDYANAGVNRNNEQSVLNRVRERVQKDAVMAVMDQFNDDDVFIYGDADEIIKPENVKWVADLVRKTENQAIIKIPLVYLQGRADLRIHHKNGKPVVWWRAMFLATKRQIMKYTVLGIRCGWNLREPVRWPTQNNAIVQDMGWHFAWMGNAVQRQTKAASFAHADDSFKWMEEGSGYADDAYKALVSQTPSECEVAPDGNEDHILQRYPVSQLPTYIFENQFIKDFLLPGVDKDNFAFNDCKCYWCQQLEWPLMYDLDGDKVWFEIPRSCSVTIKETFPDRKQIFRDSKEYKKIIKTKEPIVIFTDPVKRFISCINGYLAKSQRYYHYGKDIFASFGVDLDNCNKDDKIEYFFDNFHKISSMHQVHHFHPQCRFVDTQQFKKFTIVERQDVNDFFDINKVYNFTQKEILQSDLKEHQINFIKSIYKSDYEFLKKYGKKKK